MSEDLLITTDAALGEFLASLSEAAWLAVDTEFERERTYYPRLCLLQIATPDQVACIDPLAITDMQMLKVLMCESSVTKVFHSCSQDLEVLYQLWGKVPAPIFDSQVAATLLGLPDQLGYAALVARRLGVELPKAHTRTQWCRRPLREMELRYAGDDVRFLAQLFPGLQDELQRSERLHWLTGEFAAMSDPGVYDNPPDEAWRRIGGADRMNDEQLAALQALAGWREQRAQSRDLPRAWVVRDDALRDVARRLPGDTAELADLGLPAKLLKRHGQTLVELIAQARHDGPRDRPARERSLSATESASVARLKQAAELRAAELAIEPALLAGRKRLVRLVRGAPFDQVFAGWRRHALQGCLPAIED